MSAPLRAAAKVVPLAAAAGRVRAWRAAGERVVCAWGCFDPLTAAHARALAAARAAGGRLVVVVEADGGVTARLGASRPWTGADDRAVLVAALAVVDLVAVAAEGPAPVAAAGLGADRFVGEVEPPGGAAVLGRARRQK